MQITLIHNPEAGSDNQPSAEDLVALIRKAGHSVRYQSSKHADWHAALDEPADLIAVAGGDGVVGLVTPRLVGRQAPFTILPLGTANNVAATLKLKGRPPNELIAGWTSAARLNIDVGVAEGPWGSNYFIEGIGLGAFTDTMSKLDARRNAELAHHEDAEKKIQTVLHILKIRLEACRAVPLKITLDERDLTGEYVLLEALNIRSIGPNLLLAPDADFGDGLIDLVLVRRDEIQKLIQYLNERIAGKKDAVPQLSVHKGRRLHIESDELRIHIDDDTWPDHGEHPPYSPLVIDVTLHSPGLEVLVPA
ncbi:MAG TPA: diacylglycerol kinase family protein [Candidatus Binatia bacterium]|nr:diacylglycerol kinase family protein [Candidatus Binatia bacterium]